MTNIIVTLVSSLISGLLGILITNHQYQKSESNKIKLQVFRKIIAYRYCLVKNSKGEGSKEFFSALNEAFVVFNKDKEVLYAIKKLHSELKVQDKLNDNLIELIKRMADVLKLDYSNLNDSFLDSPFTPNF